MSGQLYSKTLAVNRVFLWISWFLKRSGHARNRAQKKWGKQAQIKRRSAGICVYPRLNLSTRTGVANNNDDVLDVICTYRITSVAPCVERKDTRHIIKVLRCTQQTVPRLRIQ